MTEETKKNNQVASEDNDDNDEDVRELAAALAPQMEQLETLFGSPIVEKEKRDEKDDDDDDLNKEWSGLKNSQHLLRQELEFAQDFGHLLSSPQRGASLNSSMMDPPIMSLDDDSSHNHSVVATAATPTQQQQEHMVAVYTLAHHARHLKLQGGWYNYPLVLEELEDCFAREYLFALSFAALKKRLVGLADPPPSMTNHISNETSMATSIQSSSPSTMVNTSPTRQSLLDEDESLSPTRESRHVEEEEESVMLPVRTVTIRIRPDVLCGAVMDAIHHAVTSLQGEVTKRQGGHLKGIVGATRVGTHHNVQYDDLPSRWTNDSDNDDDDDDNDEKSQDPMSFELPAFRVDVQLCTYKGTSAEDNECERTLLIRTYPVLEQYADVVVPPMTQSDPMELSANARLKEACALVQRMETEGSSTPLFAAQKDDPPASLVGTMLSPLKLFSPKSSRRNVFESSHNNITTDSQEELIAKELLHHARPCPSVTELFDRTSSSRTTALTFPSLSTEDWPVVQSSWRIVSEIWNQLESLDLAYACLRTSAFGAFPALPTLDVHYCSQMRRYCRESMIVSLLKTASELEQYARESEYKCASLVQTLKPMFEQYGIEPPALPMPVPLTAYPLDYTPPQVSCPPWGIKVMEALNQVAAKTSDANKLNATSATSEHSTTTTTTLSPSFDAAQEAVHLVLAAFQRQDDEEQGARLGRKNVQVMDRLAKMQAHKRESMDAISLSTCAKAMEAAQEFSKKAQYALAQQANHQQQESSSSHDYLEVPLFWCSILGGGTTTGTCFVTARHVLLVTHLLPLVGGHKCFLYELKDVELELYQPRGPRLMNTIVAPGITIYHKHNRNQQEFSFRPSMGAKRFETFVRVIQEAAMESPNKLKFSERGGLLYLYEPQQKEEATTKNGQEEMACLMDQVDDPTDTQEEDDESEEEEVVFDSQHETKQPSPAFSSVESNTNTTNGTSTTTTNSDPPGTLGKDSEEQDVPTNQEQPEEEQQQNNNNTLDRPQRQLDQEQTSTAPSPEQQQHGEEEITLQQHHQKEENNSDALDPPQQLEQDHGDVIMQDKS